MKGNSQVRFLEGGGLATARFHSVKLNQIMVRKILSMKFTRFAIFQMPLEIEAVVVSFALQNLTSIAIRSW